MYYVKFCVTLHLLLLTVQLIIYAHTCVNNFFKNMTIRQQIRSTLILNILPSIMSFGRVQFGSSLVLFYYVTHSILVLALDLIVGLY